MLLHRPRRQTLNVSDCKCLAINKLVKSQVKVKSAKLQCNQVYFIFILLNNTMIQFELLVTKVNRMSGIVVMRPQIQ